MREKIKHIETKPLGEAESHCNKDAWVTVDGVTVAFFNSYKRFRKDTADALVIKLNGNKELRQKYYDEGIKKLHSEGIS